MVDAGFTLAFVVKQTPDTRDATKQRCHLRSIRFITHVHVRDLVIAHRERAAGTGVQQLTVGSSSCTRSNPCSCNTRLRNTGVETDSMPYSESTITSAPWRAAPLRSMGAATRSTARTASIDRGSSGPNR